jgi:phosphate transport system permease protein
MTDISAASGFARPKQSILTASPERKRRNAAEVRFKVYGIVAITLSLVTLAIMLFTILRDGVSSFHQARLTFPMELSSEVLDPKGNLNRDEMSKVTTVGYQKVLAQALLAELEKRGIAQEGVSTKEIAELISKDAPGELRAEVLANPALVGTTIDASVLAAGRIDGFLKGRVTLESAERDSNVSPDQLRLAEQLRQAGMLTSAWNWSFFTNPDASDQRPEAAGLGVALLGSAYMMLMVLVTCVPVGVAASIYLEEFAPKNRWTDAIEVNISNLAAVPSIVFGILGLAIFINFAGLPQSSSIVGALVISLMTLPTIIIATRASIKAVPPSIRDAALGVGASKM